ncbi:MAG TPA: cytochrome c oxidase assembly protein [Gammaproteobacteria bacterium]|nr:cytochrome c oxidase assembly protein [Gammaproteobacteria bacterium]
MPKSIKKTVLAGISFAVLMFGFSFALVPLYRVVCQVTGLNGGVNVSEINSVYANPSLGRMITLQLVTNTNQSLPWEFYPEKNTLKIYTGKEFAVNFYVRNTSNHAMTIQAIPSFAPQVSARYFHKLECFCFRQQTLQAGEFRAMPVVFRVDTKLPEEIHVITLAYTLFDVTTKRKTA